MRVGVFGAGGAVGRAAVPELAARGHRVRAVGRDGARLAALFGPAAEPVSADLADEAQAARAADGLDAVVYAVGLDLPAWHRFPDMMRACVAAARAAGVGRLLVVSNYYPYGRPRTTPLDETHPRDPHTRKGRFRKEQEDIALAADAPGGLRPLVLRLPDFYGPAAAVSEMRSVIEAAVAGRRAVVIGSIDVPHEYVFVPDVGPVVADLVGRGEAFGTDYNLGGAGTITTRRFADLAFEAAGTRPRLLAIGPTVLRLAGLASPTARELVEMHYHHVTPAVLDDAKLRRVLPGRAKTPYPDGIARTIAAIQPGR